VRTLFFILTTIIIDVALAFVPPPNNAAALSLGGASSTYFNAFAIENNTAVLAFTNNEISLNAGNRFGLSEYSQAMLAGNIKSKLATIGFAYRISPFSDFTEQKAQLAVAKKLRNNVSAGVSVNYHRFTSTNAYYQNTALLTMNAGLYYQINKKLNTGFSLFNPNRTLIQKRSGERLAAQYRLGIDYTLAQNITLFSDFLQASEQQPDLNVGLELNKEKYKMRGGFGLNQLVALGFGWQSKALQLDVAASYHNRLGFSPSLNVAYAF